MSLYTYVYILVYICARYTINLINDNILITEIFLTSEKVIKIVSELLMQRERAKLVYYIYIEICAGVWIYYFYPILVCGEWSCLHKIYNVRWSVIYE